MSFLRFARCEPTGSFVEPGQRLGDPGGRLPGRKRDDHQPQQGHQHERPLQLARIGHRLGFRIGKQQDCAIAAGKSRQRLGKSD